MGAVDDYFGTLDPTTRSLFERTRQLVMEVAPAAEQGTSYGMAALKYKKRPLLGFRVAKRHLSIFPFSPATGSMRSAANFQTSTCPRERFVSRPDEPLPDDVVREIARLRVAEIERH